MKALHDMVRRAGSEQPAPREQRGDAFQTGTCVAAATAAAAVAAALTSAPVRAGCTPAVPPRRAGTRTSGARGRRRPGATSARWAGKRGAAATSADSMDTTTFSTTPRSIHFLTSKTAFARVAEARERASTAARHITSREVAACVRARAHRQRPPTRTPDLRWQCSR